MQYLKTNGHADTVQKPLQRHGSMEQYTNRAAFRNALNKQTGYTRSLPCPVQKKMLNEQLSSRTNPHYCHHFQIHHLVPQVSQIQSS